MGKRTSSSNFDILAAAKVKEQVEREVAARMAEAARENELLKKKIEYYASVQEAMQEREEHLMALLDNSPSVVFIKDESGKYVYLNRTYIRNFLRVKDWHNKTDFDFWPKETAEIFRSNDSMVLKSGQIQTFMEASTDLQGTSYNWLSYKFPFIDSKNQRFVAGVAINITDRIRAEEELRENKKSADAILNASQQTLALLDTSGFVLAINPAGAHRFGLEPEDMIGRCLFDFIRDADLLVSRKAFHDQVIRTGKAMMFEDEREGRHYEVMCYPVLDDAGQVARIVLHADDITERKHMEDRLRGSRDELELRVRERTTELHDAYESLKREIKERQKAEEQLRQSQKMQAIGTLAGGIAHDFNNILAAILGFTEIAIEDVADRPPVEMSLKKVLKSAMRGRDLVKQILAFSRKANYERTPLSLSPIITETVQLLRASIPANIEIRLALTAMPDTIIASPTEVQQIIMNLATNASLAMEEHGGILEIKLGDIDRMPDSSASEAGIVSGGFVELMVKDTGAGMSPEVTKRAFEPFFTTRELGEGTGMGLAVVYGIVADLEGTIVVESEPGIGSTFRVFLPKATADAREDRTPAIQNPTGSESILFVDDEDMLVEWAKATLEKLGYDATTLTDPDLALKIFTSDPSRFDLVITDQSMPSISGMQLAREILRIRPDIPVIICTGHSMNVSPEAVRGARIRNCLMKPVTRHELAQAIRRALDAPVDGRPGVSLKNKSGENTE